MKLNTQVRPPGTVPVSGPGLPVGTIETGPGLTGFCLFCTCTCRFTWTYSHRMYHKDTQTLKIVIKGPMTVYRHRTRHVHSDSRSHELWPTKSTVFLYFTWNSSVNSLHDIVTRPGMSCDTCNCVINSCHSDTCHDRYRRVPRNIFFLKKIIKIIFFSKKLSLKNKKGTMSWKYKNMKKYHKNIKTDTLGVTPDYVTI